MRKLEEAKIAAAHAANEDTPATKSGDVNKSLLILLPLLGGFVAVGLYIAMQRASRDR